MPNNKAQIAQESITNARASKAGIQEEASASSVASFLVLEGGGGGQDPQIYRQKKKIIYLCCASDRSERAPQKHIFSSAYICIHNTINAVSFNFIWYGAINSSVASFLVCTDRKKYVHVTYARASASETYRPIFSGLKIHLDTYTINAVPFY